MNKERVAMPDYLETTVDKFVFRVATDRLYSTEGIWVLESELAGRVRLGLTDYFQQRSGDMAFVQIKPAGTVLEAGAELAELETIKVSLSLFTPVAGTLLEVNDTLGPTPETINADPYGKGWLATLEAVDWDRDAARLLDPQAYLSLIRAEAEREIAG